MDFILLQLHIVCSVPTKLTPYPRPRDMGVGMRQGGDRVDSVVFLLHAFVLFLFKCPINPDPGEEEGISTPSTLFCKFL